MVNQLSCRISGETLGDFGNPGRRVTDCLLVLNAAMYALQVFNPNLIGWGAKVRAISPVNPHVYC
jgi:hypothetical protein